MEELDQRRAYTSSKIREIKDSLQDAERLADGKACVYATGSFGRGEASNHSDLDLFIVGRSDGDKKGRDGRFVSRLKRLDEICIKAHLINATRKFGIRDFSRDGEYLSHYSIDQLVGGLGTPEDDVQNTFTARILLLLESCYFVGENVYESIINETISAYWRDYDDHKDKFIPAFLANGILRMWRTFCVNYEARTKNDPDMEKAKRKLQNYKLKHSRLLTCYSALLYLLAVYRCRQTVDQSSVLRMIKLTPTARLQTLKDECDLANVHPMIDKLFDQYDQFLITTRADEEELLRRFLDEKTGEQYMRAAYEFGDSMFEALKAVGNNSRFYRLLVV